MSGLARIAVVCEGDAESPDKAWSGIVHSLVRELRDIGHPVLTLDAELYRARRVLVAARSWASDRERWKAQYLFGRAAFEARSRRAEAAFRSAAPTVDVILQIGATFRPPGRGSHPHCVYCDWNMATALRLRDNPFNRVGRIPPDLAAEMNAREAAIYSGAAAIFTLSDRLRRSFPGDYDVAAARVHTAHGGPNLDVGHLPERAARPPDAPPSVLFIGKDFERKGGDVLLQAFERVRREVPAARLRIVGPPGDGVPRPGVEMMGTLRKAVPAEFERLTEALQTSDVFCLPTRYEPFGIAVVEAMAAGLACVTSDTWAMPEMVVDGVTGLIAPDGDAAALAERLVRLLRDPDLAWRMGQAGRQRQREHFTWRHAAQVVSRAIQGVVG